MFYTVEDISPNNIGFSNLAAAKLKAYLKKYSKREWSGVIFYTRYRCEEGGNLKIMIRDFYLLNKGTSVATEFTFTKKFFKYIEKNDLLGVSQGTLHSHNEMAAFFSSVDKEDIITQMQARHEYLSVVINNKLELVAKLAKHD